jgi:hypothetical protein
MSNLLKQYSASRMIWECTWRRPGLALSSVVSFVFMAAMFRDVGQQGDLVDPVLTGNDGSNLATITRA